MFVLFNCIEVVDALSCIHTTGTTTRWEVNTILHKK